ncbi:uncharacterized protein DS421_10g301500 [Arachis hypogaea]|nr:uncharacterized protein DS421_10g301500 [Arachis hypogaea]
MLEAQALPSERMPNASASFFKKFPFTRSRHPRKRVTLNFGKMSFKQKVARTRGCSGANSTVHITRTYDPRVRVT